MAIEINYNIVDVREADCDALTYTWVQAAHQKDKAHFNELVDAGVVTRSGMHFEAIILKDNLLGEHADRYSLILAIVNEAEKETCVGYLLAFQENIVSAKIDRLCTLKELSSGESSLDVHKVGTQLLAYYIKNIAYNPVMPVEFLTLQANPNAIGFWEKMGFEVTAKANNTDTTKLVSMYMNEDTLNNWYDTNLPPHRL